MIKLFYRLFNHDKLDALDREVAIYRERVEQLEAEVKEYKGYKLKYQVAQMLLDDDEAVLELLEAARTAEKFNRYGNGVVVDQGYLLGNLAAQQRALGQAPTGSIGAGGLGMLGGLFR